VTKLDRLARSLPDARDILDELTRRNVKLSLGGSIHDPTDPVVRLLFNVLAMVAELESDLIKMCTREGMKVAKAKGRLRGKQPKLKPNHAKHLLEKHDSGNYSQAELDELFASGDPRSTAPSTGCGHNLSNPSGHSATLSRTPKPAPRGNLVQPSNATVSRYGRYAESNQGARTFSRASSSLPPSGRPQTHAMPRFPAKG
jgi:hypothetical protein